jgi:TolA-binding protein
MQRSLHHLLASAALFLPLALALPSCGGGSSDPKALTDAGYAALGSGDHDEAAEKFAAALDAIGDDRQNVSYARAKMGHVEALMRKDAAAAKDEFLAYAQANPSTVTPDHFSTVGGKFAGAGKFGEAIEVLDAGMKTHPESPALKKLVETIKTAAEKAGDSDALNKLSGLGYI